MNEEKENHNQKDTKVEKKEWITPDFLILEKENILFIPISVCIFLSLLYSASLSGQYVIESPFLDRILFLLPVSI